MRRFTLCGLSLAAVVALLAANPATAGDTPTPPKEVAVGQRAPLFTLTDQNDQEYSLQTMLKKGPVAVVFIRSIDWCSYCQLQTAQISENLPKIQATGGQVVVVCYDTPEKVKRYAKRRNIQFPILSDTDSKTIEAYAMRALAGTGDQIGSAQHGTFVIDQSGIIRSKPYLTSFEGDSAIDTLVKALKEATTTKP